MAWNKRVMQFTRERKLDPKTFEHKQGVYARQQRPTRLEKTTADFDIELDIDFEAIFRVMGQKAAMSKSGRCIDGFVTVKARKKREVSRTIEPIPIPDYLKEVTP